MTKTFTTFEQIVHYSLFQLDQRGMDVGVETWQGMPVEGRPDFVTREILNHDFMFHMPHTMVEAQRIIQPDLPWAEDHFQERVSGVPLNPGKAYKDWPYHGTDPDKFLDECGKFDISYMERIWVSRVLAMAEGIRFPYGDMTDVLELLRAEPLTRKATLPLFFPEDTGRSGRTMCSLHYHFMIRHNKLHLWYAIRSCDFVRHFVNDVYMAVRMAQWVRDSLLLKDLTVGNLYFTAYSFHYHKGDEHMLKPMFARYDGPV